MELGAFSVSLAVKDLEASRAFYEKLGFAVFAGDATQNWLILKNGAHAIGLFQGMFEKNTLTFNPGWDSNAQPLEESPTCASCNAVSKRRASSRRWKPTRAPLGPRASSWWTRTATRSCSISTSEELAGAAPNLGGALQEPHRTGVTSVSEALATSSSQVPGRVSVTPHGNLGSNPCL